MHVTSPCLYADLLSEGAAIVNSRGVPGSIGFSARTLHDSRLVVVTSCHVLHQGSGTERGVVSLATRPSATASGAARTPCGWLRIGRAGWGRRDIVDFPGSSTSERVFVDCAVVVLDEGTACDVEVDRRPIVDPVEGMRVTKAGAATGTTRGTIVDASHTAVARIDGRPCAAPKQILIRPDGRGDSFCEPGDSGAVLRDARGSIAGLMWGVSAGGYGIACPIAPVLWLLHVEPVRLPASDPLLLPETKP